MTNNNAVIFDVTADSFMTDVIEKSHQVPVLLDFWADWCEPCKNLTPILHAVVEKHPDALVLAQVDADKEQMLAQQMGIQSLPTVALLKSGQIIDNFMGVKSESELTTWLSQHIELNEVAKEPVLDDNVQDMIDAGQFEEALSALLVLPHETAVWKIIEVHLLMNDVPAAQKLYAGLSDQQLKMPEADIAKAKIQLAAVEANDELTEFKQQIAQGDVETAVVGLLELLQKDITDANVKQLLVASFGLLGDAKLAAQYRRRMGSILN